MNAAVTGPGVESNQCVMFVFTVSGLKYNQCSVCLQLALLHRILSAALQSISRTMCARVEYVRINIALCGEIKSTFKAV